MYSISLLYFLNYFLFGVFTGPGQAYHFCKVGIGHLGMNIPTPVKFGMFLSFALPFASGKRHLGSDFSKRSFFSVGVLRRGVGGRSFSS